ncbi:MAG: diguanylate cyclase [Proteobacteria bacterium]|nr:diguanylate cyclase [Pseudomonadota bacterium]
MIIRPRPIWFYFIAFSAALTLPVMAIAGYMMWNLAEAENARLQNNLHDVNRQIIFALERQQGADIAALRALATSPALRSGGIEAFRTQANAMVDANDALTNIILRDADGRVLMDTGSGVESDLPPEFLRPHEAPPELSGIALGKTFAQSGYFISTPVTIAGTARYYVIARIALPSLNSLIREQMIDDGYFASIVDGNGLILARSAEGDKYYGRKLNGLVGNLPAAFTWSGVNPQGIAVFGIFNRSTMSGWGVTTGIDRKLLSAPLRKSLLWLTTLAAVTLAIGCSIAYLLSRVLTAASRKIVTAAVELGEGRTIRAFTTPIIEANIVSTALQATSEKLRQNAEALGSANRMLERKVEERTAELAAKTELLETTMSNMDQGIVVIGPNGEIQLFNKTAADLNNVPVEFLEQGPTIAEAIAYRRANDQFEHTDDELKILLHREGVVTGKTLVHERERRNGDVIEVRTVPLADGSLVRTFTDVTLRKHAERHLEYLARHDPLTRLPNRVLFRERLEQAVSYNRRHGAPFSVLFIDLDGFKEVNDRHGHAVGDGLLIEVSARFKSALRMEDTVARLGGDEFAILQTATGGGSDPVRLARRLLEEAAGNYRIGDIEVSTGLSIGIARCPDDETDIDKLLRQADAALYRAKRQGRGTFCLAGADDARHQAG